MMKTNFDLQFSSSLILRTPAYSYEKYQSGELPLDDLYFRTAILVSSKSLYQQLEKINFDPNKLNAKMRQSLEKYFNRMCFRPTPFGLFSGISAIQWQENATPIKLSTQFKFHTQYSHRQSVYLTSKLLVNLRDGKQEYIANSSAYGVGKEIRFLRVQNDETGDRKFIVNSVERNAVVDQLIRFCQNAQQQETLAQFVSNTFGASIEESAEYIQDLIQEQILLTFPQANITGTDFLKRIIDEYGLLQGGETSSDTIQNLQTISDLETNPALKLLTEVHTLTSPIADEKPAFYVNTEKVVERGGVSTQHQQDIIAGLKAIGKLLPAKPLATLKTFADAFREKFDQQTIPLLVALDPEIGVGYQSIGSSYHQSALLKDMEINHKKTNTADTLDWSVAHKILLPKFIAAEQNNTSLQITDSDLELIPEPISKAQIPSTMSVLFRLMGEKTYIEDAGGATATALSGRFTHFSPVISENIQANAGHEETQNPDVIFAELAYIEEAHSANIDRRNNLYAYEIPIMSGSLLPENHQIALNDLQIFLSGNDIILFSKTHQKRVVPRLSSAYNYQRSQLPIFKFLGDLQHQGLHSSFAFGLSAFFPDLNHYPRVEYKNTVLSLAAWQIRKEQLAAVLAETDPFEQIVILKHILDKAHVPQHISLSEHDKQLVIDLENLNDLRLLVSALPKNKDILLKEFPFIDTTNKAVQDSKGQALINQFISSIKHNEEVYPKIVLPKTGKEIIGAKRKFSPGSEWLYLKVYCHASKSNTLLVQELLPFLESLKKEIDQYFFIRYNDPKPHLRIRLHLKDGQITKHEAILKKWNKKMADYIGSGTVHEIYVATYIRELERYPASVMPETERFFHASSELMLQTLKHTGSDESQTNYYQAAICDLNIITESFGLKLEAREYLFNKLYLAFSKEFDHPATSTEQLKNKYRELKKAGLFNENGIQNFRQHPQVKKAEKKFQGATILVAEKTKKWDYAQRIDYLASLIHMQLNRLFVDEPRKQEMIIYYCMSHYYYGLQARNKKLKTA